jgi:type IV pilus assembly protein PilF
MKAILGVLAAAALAAGCAGSGGGPVGEGPTLETGGNVVGEIGEPRNRARLHTELAAMYYSRGNMGVALEELRVAVTADGNYAPAHGMLGVVYQDLKENRLAEQSFDRALRLAPGDPDINHNFGWFLCQNKRESDSIKYFLQAIRNPLYPTPWRSYAAAGQCTLRTNDLKGAEELFQRALKLEPDDPVATLQMGQIRYRPATGRTIWTTRAATYRASTSW